MPPAPEVDPSISKGAKWRAKAVQESADEPSPPNHRNYAPDRKYARLPSLVPGGGVDPATLPRMGRLCVGPAVRGEAATFEVDDGQGGKIQPTVQPEECVGPTEPPQAVLILDVPTPARIPSLLASFTESPSFARYRSKAADIRKEYPVHAVYHLCGEGVFEDEQYMEFMNGFEETHASASSRRTHRLVFLDLLLGAYPNKITFMRPALVQAKLHQLDVEMFPIPKEDEFDPFAVSISLPELSDSVMEKFAAVKASAAECIGGGSPATAPGDDVVITPLGTGSAIPTRMHNVSSTLIQIPGHGNILLDCSEGF
ncbi:hypothetical protein L227DRAFT_616374 [Lentinus tigrinus ALCF2SS1-6]|uniref:ribonuclease Z n=1 Tax=Lentinus tigrinus ALCF2SS1-6 TaxID=1328759 RepID=A0A5C2RUG7_9APHY|nr:hypothetical protein L227DRAFT_616374 [Lentinus tigrinus ALCF2SS1-6]